MRFPTLTSVMDVVLARIMVSMGYYERSTTHDRQQEIFLPLSDVHSSCGFNAGNKGRWREADMKPLDYASFCILSVFVTLPARIIWVLTFAPGELRCGNI